MKMIKALVICKHSRNDKESSVCRLVVNPKIRTKYSWKNNLTKKDLKNIDLVISIGGDGTALSASHFLTHRPLLPVNSDPKNSVGALTTTNLKNLEKKLDQIVSNKHKTEKLERIETSINRKKLNPLALNDVFIANEKAYLISKYELQFKNKKEKQLSSGLIFSTGTGSTAWFKSARGKPFSPSSQFIKMIAREPYKGYKNTKFKYKFSDLKIKGKEKIKIKVLAPSVLAIDSIREYKLKQNDIVTINISKHPLIRIK